MSGSRFSLTTMVVAMKKQVVTGLIFAYLLPAFALANDVADVAESLARAESRQHLPRSAKEAEFQANYIAALKSGLEVAKQDAYERSHPQSQQPAMPAHVKGLLPVFLLSVFFIFVKWLDPKDEWTGGPERIIIEKSCKSTPMGYDASSGTHGG